jgi:geranylgeranyl transferase type-2 subunit beta
MSAYLQELTIRLASGLEHVDPKIRKNHSDYLIRAQQPDGGFAGRQGGSDLYYAAFGMRGLSILGDLYGAPAELAAKFLTAQLTRQQSIVDFFSLFYAANLLMASAGIDIFDRAESGWQNRIADFLESLRRDDGGYAKAAEGVAGSTYHTFLVLLVYELLNRDTPQPDRIVDFLDSQRATDGGWREIRASKRAGTNPTAAAVATLKILGRMDRVDREPTLDFLCEMQTDEGGLRANTRIPIADLLSSFTGGLTLIDLNAFNEIDLDALRRFVQSLQLPSGGFQAAAWDESHDVEYTFYGLGCLALLNEES